MQLLPNRALLGGLGLIGATFTLASAQEIQPRMGDPLPGLTPQQLADFEVGKIEFDTLLTIGDGLGPIFNDSSCSQCHSQPTIGGFGDRKVTRFGVKANGSTPFDPLAHKGGSLLQSSVIEGFDPELWGDKIPPEADVTAERLTPQAFGMGLVEAIPDSQILANLATSPGGVARWVTPVEWDDGDPLTPDPQTIGRFGWKGGVATVLTFSADASVNELGLTNRFFGQDNAPEGDLAKLALMDSAPDPEDFPDANGKERIDRQTDFQRFLAAPPQTPKSGMTGEALFNQIGCADCHVASYTTSSPIAALDNKVVRVYSDFLLHDMGDRDDPVTPGLGDGIVDGIATERMMHTRALWGLNVRTSLLHDGRATGSDFHGNVDIAVDWHRGDAEFSRVAYQALTATQRQQVGDFLMSLGRPEYDYDNNQVIDVFDWFFLQPAFAGPGVPACTPDDIEAVADIDQDNDLDLVDFLGFQRAITN